MPNPIPAFDHNLVLPPHLGSPANPNEVSPYACTTLELCERFATSPERIAILTGFLDFRERLSQSGLITGFQWLDGSFLEDIEAREGRAPRDLDIVTIYWGYDLLFQTNLLQQLPEFGDPYLSKATYRLDHYPFDADSTPETTVEYSRYWIQLFSHNRDSVWKGMLSIRLNTPADDAAARHHLQNVPQP
jgi:hypothetical protein